MMEPHTNINQKVGKTPILTKKVEKHSNINRKGGNTHKH